MASQGSARAHPHADTLAGLYELHYDRIARYIASRIGNRDDAEDMAGDVFVRAAESIGSYRERGLPMQAWLFRIAHNLVIDHYRRNAKRRTVSIEEVSELRGASDPHDEVELKLSMERVNQMVRRLNPAQQEVLGLRFIGGLSADEAGQVMGRTPGAIRELQRTALKALRSLMGPEITHLGSVGPGAPGEGGGL